MMMNKLLLFCVFSLFSTLAQAQKDGPVEMADSMRSNGKIYVVVAVLLTIFAGIIFYLVRLDRKITRIERDNERQHKTNFK